MFSEKFCAATWFGIRNENNGDFRVCCQHDVSLTKYSGKVNFNIKNDSVNDWVNSDYLQYIREQLGNNVELPECRRCWTRESAGLTSLRQNFNESISDNIPLNQNIWLKKYFQNKKNYLLDHLLIADVKISNFCNFECASCNPWDSSKLYTKWLQNQQFDLIKQSDEYFNNIKQTFRDSITTNYIAEILQQPIKVLKILGGEPLLDSRLLQMLENLDDKKKKKISLSFVTNGSVDLIRTDQKLSGFKHITYVVSVDGFGKLNEYIRMGSVWDQIENNILSFKNKNIPNRTVKLFGVIQALNALHIPELRNWCEQNNLEIKFGFVDTPAYLSLSALPYEQRKQVTDNQVLKLLESFPFNEEDYLNFKKYINWYNYGDQRSANATASCESSK